MKTNDEKEKFIELRAQGLSFSKIAEQTGISKPTLIKWNAEFSKETSNHRFLASEEVLEKYGLMKVARLEIFAKILSEALQELQKRQFEALSHKELLPLISYLEERLAAEAVSVNYTTDESVHICSGIGDQRVTIPLFD